MSEWKEVKLRDILDFISKGTTPPKGVGFVDKGINYVKSDAIGYDRRLDKSKIVQINEEIHQKFKRSQLVENDILFSMAGIYLGKNAIVTKDILPANTNQALAILRLNQEKASPNYVSLYLSQQSMVDFVNNMSGQSAQPNINFEEIKSIEINLPSLKEQTAIATVLSSLDDKIDLLHRQNVTLEKMAETLFRQWFVEEAKEEWETNILNEFISVKHGFAFKGTFITSEPNNLKLVTPGNFKIGGGFKADKFKYYTDENFPSDYIFQTNDLIITMTDLSVDGDTLGSPAFIPESYSDELYLHNQRVGKVIFKKVISKYFLYNLMRTEDYKMYIHGSASGTSIRHTSPTSICSYLFVKPPNKLIEEYDKIVLPIYNKIVKNQTQIRTLTALRDTLLPKLMSGEVRVEID